MGMTELKENSNLLNENFLDEKEFLDYLIELKNSYCLCRENTIEEIIILNIIDLANEKKYYDSAKLNYKY